MTKGETRARVIRELREEPVPVYWTIEELGLYYDDGLEELLGDTGVVCETLNITASPNQTHFPLPDNAIQALTLRDVTSTIDPRPIRLHHWKTIDAMDCYFENTKALSPEVGASFGTGEVIVWPGFASGGILEMIHTALEVDPLQDSETPRIPIEYHEGLVEYMLGRCLMKDVYEGAQLGRGQKHMKEFMSYKGRLATYAERRHINIVRSIYGPAVNNA